MARKPYELQNTYFIFLHGVKAGGILFDAQWDANSKNNGLNKDVEQL
jgi:hypothetical protein